MAAYGSTLQVKDFQKFMVLLSNTDKATKKALRDEIRQAGGHVRDDASGRFQRYDPRSAAGYRVVVRQRGVAVEQKLRRTTGKHPEFGALQMRRALVPALDANEGQTARAVEEALDRIAARFND
jgi:hypothetical protein